MKSFSRTVAPVRAWLADQAAVRPEITAILRQGFDWAYGKAVDGMPGIDGAADLASRYAARHTSADDAVRDLIRWQSGMAGAAGFLTGCGGAIALPVAMPANLASALYIQARLIAAIAHLRGHDIRTPEVRALALACLGGSKAAGTLKDAGVRLGTRMTRDTVGWLSPAVMKKMWHASDASAACGLGLRSAPRLAKLLPIVGGMLAAGFDAAVTRLIGRTADRVFSARA
jgi:uncharacterized protein (DUF697 family)